MPPLLLIHPSRASWIYINFTLIYPTWCTTEAEWETVKTHTHTNNPIVAPSDGSESFRVHIVWFEWFISLISSHEESAAKNEITPISRAERMAHAIAYFGWHSFFSVFRPVWSGLFSRIENDSLHGFADDIQRIYRSCSKRRRERTSRNIPGF